MILSLLRVKDFKVEDMMRSSFAEFRTQRQHPALREARERAEGMLAELHGKPFPEGPGMYAIPPQACPIRPSADSL
jgi:superfamily II RNA helicase